MPARKSGGSFGHVLLSVMAQAERKQFHEFACIILVRRCLMALGQIEVEQHSGISRNAEQEVVEGVKSMLTQELILYNHAHVRLRPTNLTIAASKVSMPEKGHLLQQRALRPCHT